MSFVISLYITFRQHTEMHKAPRTTYRNEHTKKYNSKILMKFDTSSKYFNLNFQVF